MPYIERTKQAFEKIEQGVREVYSSDTFKQYLSMLSKFHNYSLNNTILILTQKPNATLVAGYGAWKDNFDRFVNKGEKAIQILAPYKDKVKEQSYKTDENGVIVKDEYGNNIITEKEVEVLKFKTVNVFDISQTDGKPLPELIHELKGTSEEVKAIIETIKQVCEIPIEFKQADTDSTLLNGAKGYYSPTEDKIVINGGMDDLQIAKTLIHEYAHSLLHKQTNKPQSQREIEAESLAFVICDYFGIDTGEYSFGYIASYAEKDIDEMKSILNNIQSNAHQMISKIEPVYQEKLKEFANKNIPIDRNLAQHNYLMLEKLAKPILTEQATYMKYTAKGFMDLILENNGDNIVSMAHYYTQNGDLMADPIMEFLVDNDNKLLIPQSYQQDNLSYYRYVADDNAAINELSDFANEWLNVVSDIGYKVSKIYTEENQFDIDVNGDEIISFCKQNNIYSAIRKDETNKDEKIH